MRQRYSPKATKVKSLTEFRVEHVSARGKFLQNIFLQNTKLLRPSLQHPSASSKRKIPAHRNQIIGSTFLLLTLQRGDLHESWERYFGHSDRKKKRLFVQNAVLHFTFYVNAWILLYQSLVCHTKKNWGFPLPK